METMSANPAPSRRVLITGATGFLGGYAVREFLAHGYDVVAHGRNATVLNELAQLGATTVRGDLSRLANSTIKVDMVVHCAALSTPWGRWADFERANVAGTEQVIRFMERNRVPRLVYVSSPSVYARRGDQLNVTEEQVDPDNRLNNYIRSKIAAEALLARALELGRIPELITIRPRGLIGAGDTSVAPRLLSAYAKIGVPIFAGGHNLVDLTAVQNVALALRLAAQAKHAEGQVYNITNDDPRPFKELLDELLATLALPPKFRNTNAAVVYGLAAAMEGVCKILPGRPEPPLTRYSLTTIAYSQTLDISKAKAELGYAPTVSIEQALQAFATRYRESGALDA